MSSNYDALLDPPVDDSPEAQLEFQNFVLSDEQKHSYGKQSAPLHGGAAPVGGADFGFSAPAGGQPGPAAPQSRGGFWNVEYYSPYFNVDTMDVVQRTVATVIPGKPFSEVIGTNPDLYGPFWIATTVIFAFFVTSSVAGSIAALIDAKPYTYNMTSLSVAVTTIYVFATAVPLVLWAIIKYFKGPANLLELVDAYGYALAIWIPVSLFCIAPFELLKWILIMVAFASTVLFKVRTIRPIVAQANDKFASTLVLSGIVISDGALALLFKFYFFP
ncbi:hypothetical protein HDU88_000326 [Geranomyces variabilis]|nr:hypothetical protein HDU88_000326 [Geranomyces variabilis]